MKQTVYQSNQSKSIIYIFRRKKFRQKKSSLPEFDIFLQLQYGNIIIETTTKIN